MNKLIGILFRLAASVIYFLARTAIFALAIYPCVLDGLVENMTLFVFEIAHTVLAVCTLTAIQRATAQQGSQLRQGYAKHLMVHDMINALLTVGNLI